MGIHDLIRFHSDLQCKEVEDYLDRLGEIFSQPEFLDSLRDRMEKDMSVLDKYGKTVSYERGMGSDA